MTLLKKGKYLMEGTSSNMDDNVQFLEMRTRSPIAR